jgi:hypothetical protein
MKYKNENENSILFTNYNNEYNTFDLQAKGDKLILITDSINLKIYRENIFKKIYLISLLFCITLFLQLLMHVYLSYNNLIDCEAKINHISKTYDNNNTKEISYICASYLMHIFLLIGYFIISILTVYKQSGILFQVFEIYIIIMFISDLFFSFVNP